MKRILTGIFVLLTMVMLLEGCSDQISSSVDSVRYEGANYLPLEYPVNVFYYHYNGNNHDHFEDVDGIYSIDSPYWKMIWNGGDLYCIDNCVDEANSYYANDDNYNWYVLIDNEEYDDPDAWDIELTSGELKGIYSVESQEKDLAVFFDELEKLGSLNKISEDGVVRGTISIGKYDGRWYWRSEIIDDSREDDGTWPEYVIPLPKSVDQKIKEAE